MTLKQILIFALKHHACEAQLNKFEEFIESGDELSAWQTVQGNIRWLKGDNKLKITHKEVYDKYPYLSHMWLHSKDMKEEWLINELDENKKYSVSTWIYDNIKKQINK
jgi:hypothetical protein